MTPLEILAAAINGEPAPRIPVFCNLLDQGARELGMTQKEYYARGENVAEAQLKMLARYGHDNVWSLSYVGVEAEILGCREILFNDEGFLTLPISSSRLTTASPSWKFPPISPRTRPGRGTPPASKS